MIKRDELDIVNFPFLDRDIPRALPQRIRFARVSSHVVDFNSK